MLAPERGGVYKQANVTQKLFDTGMKCQIFDCQIFDCQILQLSNYMIVELYDC